MLYFQCINHTVPFLLCQENKDVYFFFLINGFGSYQQSMHSLDSWIMCIIWFKLINNIAQLGYIFLNDVNHDWILCTFYLLKTREDSVIKISLYLGMITEDMLLRPGCLGVCLSGCRFCSFSGHWLSYFIASW